MCVCVSTRDGEVGDRQAGEREIGKRTSKPSWEEEEVGVRQLKFKGERAEKRSVAHVD